MLDFLWGLLNFFLCTFGAVSLLTYIVPLLFQLRNKEQNLKEKYGKWALVTGASSGIGLAIVEKLASQGISVVLVALEDELLRTESLKLQKKYLSVKFVVVGADLGNEGYMQKIESATRELDIRMVFCNAGYIVPGFFANPTQPASRQLCNLECNLVSSVKIARHFGSLLMLQDAPGSGKKRGLISFTSSSAAFLPNPLSSLYSSTKAFLTNFACGLAAELRPFGIDVIVIHPSPIASRFAQGRDMLGPVKASMAIASPPAVIADDLFANAGRAIVRDKGGVTIGMKIMVKMIDYNFLTELFPYFVPLSSDFKQHRDRMVAEIGASKK